jgi:type VI secretion system secreted protein VgrG
MKNKIILSGLFVFAMILNASLVRTVSAIGTAPNLGIAASFAVLAGTTVTNTGTSRVIGDVGVSPGTTITGFTSEMVVGTVYAGDAVAAQAQTDALVAFNNLAGQACDTILTGQDLGGLTLTPGVYCFADSAQLTGTLTLNALGDPKAVFIFKVGSTLTTASNSSVLLINSANACNVFFQVGSSATFGTDTLFQGNILTRASVTLNTRASLNGRALALEGAVTLDTNNINNVCNLGPTAAAVSISGRVTTASGRGIRNVTITMIDASGNERGAQTTAFGYYHFNDVMAGETITLTAKARRFRFNQSSIVRTTNESVTDAIFVSEQ